MQFDSRLKCRKFQATVQLSNVSWFHSFATLSFVEIMAMRSTEFYRVTVSLFTLGQVRATCRRVTHMKNFAMKLKRFLKSEDGPTAVEYAVMLSLIIVVCLTAVTSIGKNASSTFTNVAAQLGTGAAS
jgi:pilus assembly protein Flp/PilA